MGDLDLHNGDRNVAGFKPGKVQELTASAPPGSPPDVLEKIKIFHGGSTKIDLARGENRARFISDMMTLINTISPRSGK